MSAAMPYYKSESVRTNPEVRSGIKQQERDLQASRRGHGEALMSREYQLETGPTEDELARLEREEQELLRDLENVDRVVQEVKQQSTTKLPSEERYL